MQTAAQPGFYVSFSGESSQPIDNLYAIAATGTVLSTQVLGQAGQELRGMALGPDGKLYVCQAQKKVSAILQFSAQVNPGGYTRAFLGSYATPAASPGLDHPYQPAFDNGNLFVTSQDTNVVTAFYGPASGSAGKAMPLAPFLEHGYASGTFNAGTFVPAFSAAGGVPPFTSVPAAQGGLTFAAAGKGGSTHSVRGLAFDASGHLFVADEAANRVAVYDAAQGNLLGAITGSNNHLLAGPVALAFAAASQNLYIGSPANQRLFAYDVGQVASGNFNAEVLIHDDDRLDKLSGIAIDGSGNLYTGTRKDNVIYQWSPSGGSPAAFAGPFDDSPEQILYLANLAG
ncbi:MAG TPA: hypothetical protein VHG32_01580 [Thermoanaerobaculia bacterium]|jgi:DNA-binding beta-propeller fold protein YncE|nr:hypothetical protein [Thermoanaerobaculia bacterium]